MSRKPEEQNKQHSVPDGENGVSRRGFLKGAGVTVAAVGISGQATMPAGALGVENVRVYGPEPIKLKLKINGVDHTVAIEPMTTLLDVMRNDLDITGAKRVCNRGFCGACTVIIDGRTANACSMLALDAAGRNVTTVEGLSNGEDLTPLQEAFVECDALQCGFCTPGMVMSCTALLADNPKPSREQVAAGISGNICRCGTYQNIFEAVELTTGQGGK